MQVVEGERVIYERNGNGRTQVVGKSTEVGNEKVLARGERR